MKNILSFFKNLSILFYSFTFALIVGVFLTELTLKHGGKLYSFSLPPWKTFLLEGSSSENPYTYIQYIRSGTVSLGRTEGIIFQASNDSYNAPLDREKTYLLKGSLPENAFFTIYAADENSSSPLYSERGTPFALNSYNIIRDPNGRDFSIYLSPFPHPGNWLTAQNATGPYKLILTLYDSPMITSKTLEKHIMPSIYPINEKEKQFSE